MNRYFNYPTSSMVYPPSTYQEYPYNQQWMEPNLPEPQFTYGHNFFQPWPDQIPSSSSNLEAVTQMALNLLQLQEEIIQQCDLTNAEVQRRSASMNDLERQVEQLATSVNELKTQMSGTLPSHTIINPRESANAINLRSGRVLNELETKTKQACVEETLEDETEAWPLENQIVEKKVQLSDSGPAHCPETRHGSEASTSNSSFITLSKIKEVKPNLTNSDLEIILSAPFPLSLLGIQIDDLKKEKDIKVAFNEKLEFDEIEVDESYLTREEDLDSEEEAYMDDYSSTSILDSNFEEQEVNSNLVNSNFDTDECALLCPFRQVILAKEDTQEELSMSMNHGDDHWDLDEEECCQKQAMDNTNMNHSPIIEELCYNDPDFLGIEAFIAKSEIWELKDKSFGASKACKYVKVQQITTLWIKAKVVCPKTILHKPMTATTMALTIIAIHGVPSLSDFFPSLLLVIIFSCAYMFKFLSYILFALQWQDPP